MNRQMYLVKFQSKKKGIFMSDTELGLLSGSLSDCISFRKDACCARTVQIIPITFGIWSITTMSLRKLESLQVTETFC